MVVCLVTGGAGFLGSHLAESLVARDHTVRILDNFRTGSLTNLSPVIDSVELYPGDLEDLRFVRQVMRGVELVFHLADGSPGDNSDSEIQQADEDIGILNVLTAAYECRVRRLIYGSSVRVYGAVRGSPVTEEDSTLPQSGQAQAKLSGERACATYTRVSGLETVRLRYSHVYGPRQYVRSCYASMVFRVIEALNTGVAPVLKEGLVEQDLLYVEDAVHATLLAAEVPRAGGRVYNIGRGQQTATQDVINTVNRIMGTTIAPVVTNTRLSTDLNHLVSVVRAETDLGFCAATDLEAGLRKCLARHLAPVGKPHLSNIRRRAIVEPRSKTSP